MAASLREASVSSRSVNGEEVVSMLLIFFLRSYPSVSFRSLFRSTLVVVRGTVKYKVCDRLVLSLWTLVRNNVDLELGVLESFSVW